MEGKNWSQRTVSLKNLTVLVVILVLIPGYSLAEEENRKFSFSFGPKVKVMTPNVNVGADLFKILNPDLPDNAPLELPEELTLPIKAAQVFQMIQQTDFIQRVEAIADQIALHNPHLIGLQEVYIIKYQHPSNIFPNNPYPDADQVLYDYLLILQKALEAKGLIYKAVAGAK